MSLSWSFILDPTFHPNSLKLSHPISQIQREIESTEAEQFKVLPKPGGNLKGFALCPFVTGVQPWSDSLGNWEGVSLNHIVQASPWNKRKCSSLGKQLPIPHYQETTWAKQSLAVGMEGNHSSYLLHTPLLGLWRQGRPGNRTDASFFPEGEAHLDPSTNWPWQPILRVPSVYAIVHSIL